jgi:catechol 2,3-dioxygenase-like lactoylglutathione lyase family enzyme
MPVRSRYAHTNLIANDWKKIADFYIHVFGCQPVSAERDHHGPWVADLTAIPGARVRGQHLRLPGYDSANAPTLEVFQYHQNLPSLPTALNRPGFAHIAFEVDDVEQARRLVLEHGGADHGKALVIDIPGAGRLNLVYMRDPEGNVVELQKWLDKA